MTKETKRKLRRFRRKVRGPLLYVAFVGGCLAVYLAGLHSCAAPPEQAGKVAMTTHRTRG